MFLELLCYQVLAVCMLHCQDWMWPRMGLPSWGQAFPLRDLFWFTSDLPYEVTRLKGSWLNLCIASPCCSKFGGFFPDLSYVLDFVCCFEFYFHIFFILLLLEQQSPCWWFADFHRDHGVCAICESVRSIVGGCMGNWVSLSVTMAYGRSYLQMRCFQVNFSSSLAVISHNGLASIHLVK